MGRTCPCYKGTTLVIKRGAQQWFKKPSKILLAGCHGLFHAETQFGVTLDSASLLGSDVDAGGSAKESGESKEGHGGTINFLEGLL